MALKPYYNINYEKANLNPKYRFDTFVVGSNNKFAHSAALAVAESPGEAYNPLYLYGRSRTGQNAPDALDRSFVLEQNQDKKVLYVTSEQFTNEVIESIRSGMTGRRFGLLPWCIRESICRKGILSPDVWQ